MNTTSGFIVLHRKIVDWEWYHDSNTFCLFLHLLLTANYEDGRFEGRVVKRGQLVTSLSSLSKLTGLSIRQTRTALSHLVSTGEVTNESCSQYRVITIVNYGLYQDKRQSKRQTTDKQPTNDATSDRQQYNNNNNINNGTINKEKEKEKPQTKPFTPPTLQEVLDYVSERGNKIDGEYFFYYYEDKGWDMKNWKAKIITWEKREEKYKNGSGNGRGSGSPEGNHGQNRPDYSKFSAGIIQL